MVRDQLSVSLPQPQNSTLNRLTGSRVPQSDFFLFSKEPCNNEEPECVFYHEDLWLFEKETLPVLLCCALTCLCLQVYLYTTCNRLYFKTIYAICKPRG